MSGSRLLCTNTTEVSGNPGHVTESPGRALLANYCALTTLQDCLKASLIYTDSAEMRKSLISLFSPVPCTVLSIRHRLRSRGAGLLVTPFPKGRRPSRSVALPFGHKDQLLITKDSQPFDHGVRSQATPFHQHCLSVRTFVEQSAHGGERCCIRHLTMMACAHTSSRQRMATA